MATVSPLPKLKPETIFPAPEEATVIDAGIAADPDAREWTDADFAQAKPASQAMPPEIHAARINAALRQYLTEHPPTH